MSQILLGERKDKPGCFQTTCGCYFLLLLGGCFFAWVVSLFAPKPKPVPIPPDAVRLELVVEDDRGRSFREYSGLVLLKKSFRFVEVNGETYFSFTLMNVGDLDFSNQVAFWAKFRYRQGDIEYVGYAMSIGMQSVDLKRGERVTITLPHDRLWFIVRGGKVLNKATTGIEKKVKKFRLVNLKFTRRYLANVVNLRMIFEVE